jgi:hypothetical protein
MRRETRRQHDVPDGPSVGYRTAVLSSLTLERYRCFATATTLELAPLTVLFGKNSAGKSALVRALPIAAASCSGASVNRSGPLALEHPAAMGARFADVRTRLSHRNDVGITLAWQGESISSIAVGLREMGAMAAPARQIVERFAALDADGATVLDARFDPDEQAVIAAGTRDALTFDGLLPATTRPKSKVGRAVGACRRQLSTLAASVDWLAPVRATPSRPRVAPLDVAILGPAGEHLTEVLAQPNAGRLFEEVRRTARNVLRLELELDREAGDVGLAFRTHEGLTHVLDVGSGVPQLLPVLVRLAQVSIGASEGRIVAIEQPEAHLHADAEAALARVIVESLAKQVRGRPTRPRVILETHSENLFLSLQLAVLEGRLSPDDVVLYWMSQADDGSVSPQRFTLDPRGVVTPQWPPGVFSEDMNLARRLVSGRQRRAARNS